MFIQLDKSLGHGFGQFGVHGEVFTAPVHASTHAAHLAGDGVAALLFPFPHFGNKVFARFFGRWSHFMAADAFGLQLALHHHLGGNAGMVSAWNPRRVKATHAVVTRQ